VVKMNIEFSKKLIDLRKEKGISQEFLADRLFVSRQTISKWELGETTPDLENLASLANFFEISLDELVFDKKYPSPIEKEVVNNEKPKTVLGFLYDFWWLIFIILGMIFMTIKKTLW